MLFQQEAKLQGPEISAPDTLPPDVIISPDTRRNQRLPPGQTRTRNWPVLDASGTPAIDLSNWRLRIRGLVRNPVEWTLEQFQQLPRVKVFSDFHCVTRWSRLGNVWEGVGTRDIVKHAGGLLTEAQFVLAHAYDSGWTTNLSIDDVLAEDSLVAFQHDGEPLTAEHGGPARLIVPRLYAWKSAKWLSTLEFLDDDTPGFWERNGYHMHGNPWKEERYSW